jgi:hypothetical protein
MRGTAILSACGAYRYTLHRQIPSVLRWVKPCLFVMLNPSTADATVDDPTIRRCISFAKREGCTDLTVVNLFALRATDPVELTRHADPIGPDNAKHVGEQIIKHQQIGLIIAAWGSHSITSKFNMVFIIKRMLHTSGAFCLGVTKDGSPRHPLYVRNDQPLIPYTHERHKT